MSFLSWDSFLNLTGEDIECIPVLSDSSDMAPPLSRRKDKRIVEEIDELVVVSPPPIFRDTLCTFSKDDSMRWYQIYQAFAKLPEEFPEDLPDREVYLAVKRSKLHLAGAHPAIFPCPEIID